VSSAFSATELFAPLERTDLEWTCLGGFAVETQTFYQILDDGRFLMGQAIYSSTGYATYLRSDLIDCVMDHILTKYFADYGIPPSSSRSSSMTRPPRNWYGDLLRQRTLFLLHRAKTSVLANQTCLPSSTGTPPPTLITLKTIRST
jgi:hypothetical protein